MKRFILILALGLACTEAFCQRGAGGNSWEVTINTMDSSRRDRISRIAEDIQERGGGDRSVLLGMLTAAGSSLVSSAVDITASEVVRLMTYRQEQKKEWTQMLDRECNYTDEISSVKGLNDFYEEPSRYGALDPSGINFDGISVRGMKDGKEVLYLSCHIDTTRLDHLFRHSKFFLVLDTLCFHPYNCHIPNLGANGIRDAGASGSARNNSFSYDERENLSVGMEMTISSSWINEAVMLQNNVELGKFSMNVSIPAGTQMYTYSASEAGEHPVVINGDCFVVPRSYMPISGEDRMWGTGEYFVKVKLTEKCRFCMDESKNDKAKHWHRDYVQLRKMQKKSPEVVEYMNTVWKQNGNNIIKSTVRQSLNAGASGLGLTSSGSTGRSGAGGTGSGAGSGSGSGGGAGGGAGGASGSGAAGGH